MLKLLSNKIKSLEYSRLFIFLKFSNLRSCELTKLQIFKLSKYAVLLCTLRVVTVFFGAGCLKVA